ncbi:hypothetical protein JXC34_06265 [Candidatus Woesearchaeota archaeon]|nr:hypothetical protein [Candidatus Woesearchaeota archaeon]
MIISKIKEKTGISDTELNSKVRDKLDQLSGLISEEGALHIIANEMGVKIFEEVSGELKIKNVLSGMRSVDITGKVVKVYEVRTFEKEGRQGRVGNFLIGDETGVMRVVAWNDQASLLQKLKEGDIVKIEAGYTRENQGKTEVHLGQKTNVVLSPKNVEDIDVKPRTRMRKKIAELNENDQDVEVIGTIVQVFDPRFFEICPECGKRAKERDGSYYCDQHDKVTPGYSYVANLFLDDGTENIRTVLWRTQLQRLFGMSNEEIVSRKDGSFEDIKTELLGKIVKFVGRTSKNEMFERIEFIPQLVFTDPDPNEEISRLNEEIKEKVDEPEPEPSRSPVRHEEESVETYDEEDIESGLGSEDEDVEEITLGGDTDESDDSVQSEEEDDVEEISFSMDSSDDEESEVEAIDLEEESSFDEDTEEDIEDSEEIESVDLSVSQVSDIAAAQPQSIKPIQGMASVSAVPEKKKDVEVFDDIEDLSDLDSL